MAQTFWTGSNLSFTNGSKIVTVNTGPSVDSIYPNSKLKSGNYNEPVEVKAAYGSTIELYENWPGSTTNTSATVTPSSAAAAAAGVAAQQVVTEIQNLVGSASSTATANSFVKRDSNGRIKAANPSANDDVVTKGFIGSAATRDVGTSAGNVMEVGAFGQGTSSPESISDYDLLEKGGMYADQSLSTDNQPIARRHAVQVIPRSNQSLIQHAYPIDSGFDNYQHFARLKNTQGFKDWVEYYHSGNSVNPLDYGLGASVTREAKDWNSALKAGFWRSTSGGGQVNSPDDSQAGWYGFVAGLNDNNIHQQVTLPSSSNSRTYMRTMQSGIWSPWVELYHSGNTNFNEFGGGSGDVVAMGAWSSTNVIRLILPLVGTSPPSSITVTGTFTIKADNTVVATGVTGGELELKGYSSNKVGVIEYTSTGLTPNSYAELVTESSTSKITVNF